MRQNRCHIFKTFAQITPTPISQKILLVPPPPLHPTNQHLKLPLNHYPKTSFKKHVNLPLSPSALERELYQDVTQILLINKQTHMLTYTQFV